MILQLRIESKLYNGIVTEQNAREVSAKMILMANDKTAGDSLMKQSVLAQVNPEFKAQVRGISESIRLLSDPRAEGLRVQIICTSPADGKAFLQALGPVETIVGKYKAKGAGEKLELGANWILDKEDLPVWEDLYRLSGGLMYGQLLPEHEKQDFAALLKKAGNPL